MTRLPRAVLGGLLAMAAALVTASPSVAEGKVTTVSIPSPRRIETAVLADVDGDGRDDLVLSISNPKVPFARALHVFPRQDGLAAFAPEADQVLDLTPDVVGWAVGDVTEAPGAELVLLTATGAFAWSAGAGELERPRKLVSAEVLWQLPDPRETLVWQAGLLDLNGDGLTDLLLPEPDGYRVAFQRRVDGEPASFDRVAALRIPEGGELPAGAGSMEIYRSRSRERLKELRVHLSLGISDRDDDRSVLSVHDAVPSPTTLDWDADGRADVLALSAEELLVWRQREDATFELRRFPFPVTINRGRLLDLSFGAHAADLDGDRRADCVVLAGDRNSDAQRTQILVYVQGQGRGRDARTPEQPLFGARGLPSQVLMVGGFTGSTDLTDVDGNGLPDLVLGTVKVDAVDVMRAESTGSLDAHILVYLNREGQFSKRPDLSMTVPLRTEELGEIGDRLVARFIGDLDGDRVAELLLRDREERIRVHVVRRTRSGLAIREEPFFETRIDDDAEVLVFERSGRPAELLVLEKRRLLHVRFR